MLTTPSGTTAMAPTTLIMTLLLLLDLMWSRQVAPSHHMLLLVPPHAVQAFKTSSSTA